MTCRFCDGADATDAEFLFVWPPQPHTEKKLTKLVTDHGAQVADAPSGAKRIDRPQDGWDMLLVTITGGLSTYELQDSRALLTDVVTPGMADLPRVTSLRGVVSLIKERWLDDIIDGDRLISVRQGIFDRDGARYANEMLLRGQEEDGTLLTAGALFGAVGTPRRLARLDRAARIRAVTTAAQFPRDVRVFINFIPSSIYDPAYCLRTTVSAAAEAGIDPGRIVFEVVETERIDDIQHLKGITSFYRKAGFLIALDDFGAGYSNFGILHRLRPDYVKLDMSLTRAAPDDDLARGFVTEVVRITRQEGIQVVAEGLETQEQAHFMREIGVDFFQGWLFEKPSPVTA